MAAYVLGYWDVPTMVLHFEKKKKLHNWVLPGCQLSIQQQGDMLTKHQGYSCVGISTVNDKILIYHFIRRFALA